MNRWKVHRTTDEINPWAARYDGWQDGGLIIRKSHHGTWAEAIAHADHMARTVEVTLPRVAPHPDYGYLVDPDDPWVYSWDGRWHLAPIGDWDSHAALLCNDVGEYKIHASELKPLALALLAQHYRKEEA